MASIETPRPSSPETAKLVRVASEIPPLSAFHAEGDRLIGYVAYGLAIEKGLGTGSDAIERLRGRAVAELADHAARTMHNRITEIQREAVAAHPGMRRQPMGFLAAVVANLTAILLTVILAWLAIRDSALIARMTVIVGG